MLQSHFQSRLIDSCVLCEIGKHLYSNTFKGYKNVAKFLSQGGGGNSKLNSVRLAWQHFLQNLTKSHKLPKIALALFLLGANITFAEDSSAFVGIGIGGGGNAFGIEKIKQSRSGLSYGFVIGYKKFFNECLGLRFYANLDLHHNMSKLNSEDKALKAIFVNFGVNMDFLANFISNESLEFGAFAGTRIGATKITGKDIEESKNRAEKVGVKFIDTALDVALNVGLRTNIATNHGIEIALQVPFLPVELMGETTTTYRVTFGQEYSILARYTFHFD